MSNHGGLVLGRSHNRRVTIWDEAAVQWLWFRLTRHFPSRLHTTMRNILVLFVVLAIFAAAALARRGGAVEGAQDINLDA